LQTLIHPRKNHRFGFTNNALFSFLLIIVMPMQIAIKIMLHASIYSRGLLENSLQAFTIEKLLGKTCHSLVMS